MKEIWIKAIWMEAMYLLELSKWLLVFHLMGRKKRAHIPASFAGGLFSLLAFFLWQGSMAASYILLHIFAVFCAVFMVGSEKKNLCAHIFATLFFVQFADEFCAAAAGFLQELYGRWGWWNVYSGEFVCSLFIVVFLCLLCATAKRKGNLAGGFAGKLTGFAIFGVSAMGLLFLIAVQLLADMQKNILDKNLALAAYGVCVWGILCLACIGSMLAYEQKMNKRLRRSMQTEKKLNQMQVNYLEEMLARETDTRKYRHDMSFQLLCLKKDLENGQTQEAERHLAELLQKQEQLKPQFKSVGNNILDAIINYYLPQAGAEARVQIIGGCHRECRISRTDLCTVFANLIENAAEELQREHMDEKFVNVSIRQGEQFLELVVENSTGREHLQKTDFFRSEKQDKQVHGIGLLHVQEVIKKNGGEMETEVRDGYVRVRVVLEA